jgi:rare lipoprotein A
MKINYLLICIFSISCLCFQYEASFYETGNACYYSSKFNGRKTSSGEIFSQENLTAAHKTLKLGTYVKVTNLVNDSTVIVKVNDRLNKNSSHVIDLTLKAANQLNFVRMGIVKVKIESTTITN